MFCNVYINVSTFDSNIKAEIRNYLKPLELFLIAEQNLE